MFYEVRFPPLISYGSSGGAGWLTRIVSTQAGVEYRSGAWTRQRGKWNAAHGLKLPADYQQLIAFHYAMQGRLNSFRWKDWLDYTDQGIGKILMNPGGVLQLAKVYSAPAPIVSGATQPTYTRFIDKPVPGTMSLPTGATLNYTSGVVTGGTFSGDSWTGQFDVPVRFDIDMVDMSIDKPYGTSTGGASADVSPSWRNIPIIEVKLPVPLS